MMGEKPQRKTALKNYILYTALGVLGFVIISSLFIAAKGLQGNKFEKESSSESLMQAIGYDGESLEGYLDVLGKTLAKEPIIVKSIENQNTHTQSYDAKKIKNLDARWRENDALLIDESMKSDLSLWLGEYMQKSGGAILEIIVMDGIGLNVGQSDKTSDYWQGDEDKFIKSYNKGRGATYIGDLDFDESTGAIQIMTAIPVSNGKGKVIGAIAVAVNPLKTNL